MTRNRWRSVTATGLLPLLLPVLILAMPGSALGALSAAVTPWLQKLIEANTGLDYKGTLVYLQNGGMSTVAIEHHSGPGGIRERLTALDGQPRDVVRGIKLLRCRTAPGPALEIPLTPDAGDSPPQISNLDQLDQLDQSYQIALGEQQRIAARTTQRIDLQPRGDYRYGQRLWLDVDTGLPLKTQIIGSDGSVIEQALFTEIRYLDPTTQHDNDSDSDSATNTDHTQPNTPFTPSDWHAAQLPIGFRLATHRRVPGDNSDQPTEQLVYSDGMTTVSVFIEPLASGDTGFSGISQRGSITLYGRTVGDQQLTVIGEVPQATIRHIGDGLHQQPASTGGTHRD